MAKSDTATCSISNGPSAHHIMYAQYDPDTTERTVEFQVAPGTLQCIPHLVYRVGLNEWIITGTLVSDDHQNFRAAYNTQARKGKITFGPDVNITRPYV